jgi:hypothetical protein
MKVLFLTLLLVSILCGGECFTVFVRPSPHAVQSLYVQQHATRHHGYQRRVSSQLQAEPLDILYSLYKDELISNPVQTKIVTGGVLAFLGDAIAQTREPEYNQKRAAAFVSFDGIYRAVQCTLFPQIIQSCDGHYLAALLPNLDLDVHVLATMEQTLTNQFLVVPFIYYPVFFSLTGYLQGLPLDATIQRVRNTLFPLLKRNWLFWIPVQYYQFGYVDEPLQIPFLCVVGLAWTFILSFTAGSVQSYEKTILQPVEEDDRDMSAEGANA